MPKKYRLQSFSLILTGIVFLLSGCESSVESSESRESDSISVVFGQGDNEMVVPEDSSFSTFLNSPNGDDDVDVPVPQWNSIGYDSQSSITIQLKNCPTLDLLETVIYTELDEVGRPSSYEYVPICGPETELSCTSDKQVLPSDAQEKIAVQSVEHFAISGICVGYDTLDARSFISFMEKREGVTQKR